MLPLELPMREPDSAFEGSRKSKELLREFPGSPEGLELSPAAGDM